MYTRIAYSAVAGNEIPVTVRLPGSTEVSEDGERSPQMGAPRSARGEIRDCADERRARLLAEKCPPPCSLRRWLSASLLARGRLSAFALRDSARPRTLPLGHTARGEDFIYTEPHGDGDGDADGRNPVEVSI